MSQDGDEINIDFKIRDNSSEYLKILENFIESKKMNLKIVLFLVMIIFIIKILFQSQKKNGKK